jgi:hypothetical protein
MADQADQEQIRSAIGARILAQLDAGATSDTILKLAEAYAWIVAPDNAHGGRESS